MNARSSSEEILLVVRPADAGGLTELLVKSNIAFAQGRPEDLGQLGFDFNSLVQIAVHAGAVAGLSSVLVAYLKHRKRTVHVKKSDGRIEVRGENLGKKEVDDILARAEGKDQMWLLEETPQRAVKKTRSKSKAKSKAPSKKRAKRATKPAKSKRKAASSRTGKKSNARSGRLR